jgi:ribosomal protein L21E
MAKIRQNLKTSQDRKKSYASLNRLYKEFKVGDHVYMRVNPKKSSLKLVSCAKLAPIYC